MRGFRQGLWIFLLLMATFALGDITESTNWLLTSSEHSLIRRAQEATGVPPPPYNRGIGVFARHYGGFAQIYVFGNDKLSAERLAEVLNNWTKTAGLGAKVLYSQEKEGPTVLVDLDRRHFFARRSSTRIPARSLIEALRQVDPDVSAAWYVPNHAATNLRVIGDANFVDLSQSVPENIEVSTTVTLGQIFAFLSIGASIPFFAGIGAWFAVWYARKSNIPVEKRRAVYHKLFLTGFSVGLAVAFTISVLGTRTSFAAPLLDVWLATADSLSVSMGILALGFAVSFPILLGLLRYEPRLLGPEPGTAPDSAPTKPLRPGDLFTPIRLMTLLLGLGITIYAWNLGTKSELLQPLKFIGMVLIAGGHFFDLKKPRLPSSDASDQSKVVANEVFAQLQYRPIPVRRVDSDKGAIDSFVMAGQLNVTPAFEVDLSRSEMKFLMTRALVRGDALRFPWQVFIPLLPVAIASVASIVLLADPWRYITPAALLPIALIPAIAILRKQSSASFDGGVSGALRSTRDIAAARSSLEKCYRSLPPPGLHEELRRREQKSLEETAKELGLH